MLQGRPCRISSGARRERSQGGDQSRKATAEARTGGTGSLVLGVPWDKAGNQLLSEGIDSMGFIWLQHSITSDQCTGAQTQAGGGNGRTSAVQTAYNIAL